MDTSKEVEKEVCDNPLMKSGLKFSTWGGKDKYTEKGSEVDQGKDGGADGAVTSVDEKHDNDANQG